MKQLTNKKTEIPLDDNRKMTYADLIKVILKVQPPNGFTVDDMKTRMKLFDVMEKPNGEIDMEDSDFAYLKPLVKNMRWAAIHQDLITFADDVENVK